MVTCKGVKIVDDVKICILTINMTDCKCETLTNSSKAMHQLHQMYIISILIKVRNLIFLISYDRFGLD